MLLILLYRTTDKNNEKIDLNESLDENCPLLEDIKTEQPKVTKADPTTKGKQSKISKLKLRFSLFFSAIYILWVYNNIVGYL